MSIVGRLRKFSARVGDALRPSDPAWRGAIVALQLMAALVLAGFVAAEVAPHSSVQKLGASAMLVGGEFSV